MHVQPMHRPRSATALDVQCIYRSSTRPIEKRHRRLDLQVFSNGLNLDRSAIGVSINVFNKNVLQFLQGEAKPCRHLTQACSSDDSGCNRDMEILDCQNSSNPVKLILW